MKEIQKKKENEMTTANKETSAASQKKDSAITAKRETIKTSSSKSYRLGFMALSTLLFNPFLKNFKKGALYQGSMKQVCVPVLNCYSCPAAAGSCPIGSLQVTLTNINFEGCKSVSSYILAYLRFFPLYAFGLLALVGTLIGRSICGWLCPFGLYQELLGKITKNKRQGWHYLRYLKYIVLILAVFIVPVLLYDGYGGKPAFCQYICPAGLLQAGLPLIIAQESLRSALGWLFAWKASILALISVLSVFYKRPFCRWLCPLGAFYAPFNKFSLLELKLDKDKCINCQRCSKACPVSLTVTEEICSGECVRCNECKRVCPVGAISLGIKKSGNSA